MKALEAIATAIQDDDREQGHLGADQQWGKYESNARAVVVMAEKLGLISVAMLKSILDGKV